MTSGKRPVRWLKTVPKVVSIATIVFGSAVLVGWALDIPVLKSVLPNLVTMKVNTAFAFVLLGASVWFLRIEDERTPRIIERRIGQGLAVAVAMLGVLTLIEYMSSVDLGIDQALFRETSGAVGTSSPGRMAPTTALNFFLLGSALLLLDVKFRGQWPSQPLTIVAGLVALGALIGYSYGVRSLYGIAAYTDMALHTAALFIVLVGGILLMRPDHAPMSIFLSNSPGGAMARRLVPAAILIPLVLSWIRLAGERAGLYDTEYGLWLMVTSSILLLCAITWVSARSLDRLDAGRKRAEEALRSNERRLSLMYDTVFDILFLLKVEPGGSYRFVSVNKRFTDATGLAENQIVGKRVEDVLPKSSLSLVFGKYEEAIREKRTVQWEEVSAYPAGERVGEVTVTPIFDEDGNCSHVFGTVHDITERKRAERREGIRFAVTRALAESETAGEAISRTLRSICEGLAWDLGESWRVDLKSSRIRWDGAWHTTSPEVAEFSTASHEFMFAPGEGLPGRVWASGQPAWIADVVSDSNFPRAPLAARAGLHGAFAFPIHRENDVTGVMAFYSTRSQAPDDELLRLMEDVGSQIGESVERKRAEERLRESEANLAAAQRITHLGSWELDLVVPEDWMKGPLRWSDEVFRIFGYEPGEVEVSTENFYRAVHPDDRDAVNKAVGEAIQQGKRYSIEHRIILPDGTERIVHEQSELIYDETSGQPLKMVGTVLDITERKRAEERFRGLMESAPDAMVIADADGKVALVNAQTEKLFGYRREELLGQSVELLMPDRFRDRHREHRAAYSSAPHSRSMGVGLELYGMRKDGSEFPVEVSLSPLETEKGVLVSSAIRDITDRKRAEEELAERAVELARSNADLEQFAYVASHDLQEPLRTVTSYVQLLARRYKDKLGSDSEEYVNFVVEGATRMQTMINDLLAYSRVGRRGGEFKPTDSGGALKQAVANLQTAIDKSGAVTTYDGLPTVVADPTQLTQLFQNLISNAIKFRAQTPPRIHVSAEKRRDEWVFSVHDNGIGIDPKYFDRIFVIFQRLHTKSEYPGTGIGLAICKKIVERHGGRIWLESQPNAGSTFHFSIPAKGDR